MKTFLGNAALTVASVLLALMVGEVGLRLTGFQPGNPFERLINHRDDFLGYRLIPGMHETIPGPAGIYTVDIIPLGFDDGIGFRDDGINPPVDSVFIGDSFVWGYGVELADSLSERFEALTGKDAVNLGMTSWTSPTQYARILEKYGSRLKPRHAFMEALVDNDFEDLTIFAAWEASDTEKSYPEWATDRVMRYTPDALSYKVRRFLYDRSALGRLVSDRVQFGLREPEPNEPRGVFRVVEDGLDLQLDGRAFSDPLSGPDAEQIDLYRAALLASRETANRSGIRLIVFIVPTKELVYQDRFPDPVLRTAVDRRYLVLKDLLAELRIEYVDLLPPLRSAAAQGKQLYFAEDTHWTALGHDLAASVLRDYVAAPCDKPGCAP